ncbi:hypothetical protein E8E13_010443 [Curvularia kusanoi]|uniref:Uncharacterized protein n=1 Tax=Curvularia kusanoi TaxID=90978 RepID=A0A9P4TQ42_CURKU|nr:hypothetical protein E8E13_010443 [Curvularia kusanoi]
MSVPTLLTLPPELRNLIYKYVLTPDTTKNLQYCAGEEGRKAYLSTWTDDAGPNANVEFNKLKYVNRQLYAETAALELVYTHGLVFRRLPGSEPGGATAVRFLLELSPKKCTWLSTIRIQETLPQKESAVRGPHQATLRDSPETMSSLDKICTEHPKLNVQYQPPHWRLSSSDGPAWYHFFFIIGAIYAYLLRDREQSSILTPFVELQIRDSQIVPAAKEWLSAAQPLRAPNLRFYPRLTTLDKDTRNLSLFTIPSAQLDPRVSVRDYKVHIQEWLSNGF